MPEPKQQGLFESANRLDGICDRFESAWRAGQQPRIEEYLQPVSESDRAALLRELLACELDLLMKSGRPADEAVCCRRFPESVDVVRAVFADSPDYAFFGKLRDYELQQKLGEGGMGVVYKAVQSRLKRPVAIKLLPPEKLAKPETVSRFHREMEAIGQLDDQHIVRAHDAGEVDGTHYLVMEFIDGLDLRELQERVGPLSMANACEIIRQAALGLQSASKAGLVHRDLKPSNLMLTRGGTVKILDLGLAQVGSKMDSVDRPELTSTGQIMGTFDYLAPEQATDTRNVDIRADIYGLGCTLFKLLTGRAPYSAQGPMTAYQRIRAHLEDPIPSAAASRADVPAELDSLLEKMLAKQAV
ncbi:MAG: serine/threonine-protein kinase, partial [Planctomycetota bacterium]|nr:serine/threonine-protein kinase [Planctomycetota bacterium]